MLRLNVNGKDHDVDVPADTPLLWVLRDELKLVGTKFGCGVAQCGACTVQLNGAPVRSCSLPASAVAGQKITTIEGLAKGNALTAASPLYMRRNAPCPSASSGQSY